MHMIETLALEKIRIDGGTQPREYLNELVLSDYAEAMAEGDKFPPLVIFYDGSHYWLADGFHRFFATKQLGHETIAAEVHPGTRRDALFYAVGANAVHGLRRTNAYKRRSAMTLLQDEEWQRWSNREIARQCGVTHSFVSKLRKELVTASQEEDGLANDHSAASASIKAYVGEEFTSDGYTPDTYSEMTGERSSTGADGLMITPPESTTAGPMGDGGETAGVRPSHGGEVSIAELAAASQQTPAEWVAEMMAYWLLDLSHQYKGVTEEIVQQAAERLVRQYTQACEAVSAPSHDGGSIHETSLR